MFNWISHVGVAFVLLIINYFNFLGAVGIRYFTSNGLLNAFLFLHGNENII